jgi:hypothetical protein
MPASAGFYFGRAAYVQAFFAVDLSEDVLYNFDQRAGLDFLHIKPEPSTAKQSATNSSTHLNS